MTRKIFYTEVPDNEPDTLRKYANDFKKFLFDNFNVSVINNWLSDSASDKSIIEGLPEEYDRGFYLVAHLYVDFYYGWQIPKFFFNCPEDEYIEIFLNDDNYIGCIG